MICIVTAKCTPPGSLLAFEGLDGSGKSTQIRLLLERLSADDVPFHFVDFPRLHQRGYGEAIAMFLRGEFGSVETVHPYLIASLFAGDRAVAAPSLHEALSSGGLVVADRYFYSNLAFQSAKFDDPIQRDNFGRWLHHIEFTAHAIPPANINIFFDVPMTFVRKNIAKRSDGARPYLQGQSDIHEGAIDLQRRVASEYHRYARRDSSLQIVDCVGTNGAIRPEVDIHNEVMRLISPFIPVVAPRPE